MSPAQRARRRARQPSPQRQQRRAQRAASAAPSVPQGATTAHPLARDIMRAARAAMEGQPARKVALTDLPEDQRRAVVDLLELHALTGAGR